MLLFEFNVPYHIGKGACEGKSQNADWRTCPLCGLLNTMSKPGDGYAAFFLSSLKTLVVTSCSPQPQNFTWQPGNCVYFYFLPQHIHEQ